MGTSSDRHRTDAATSPSGLADLDVTAQAELLRRKEVSPVELVDAAIERAERLNPAINAIITPATRPHAATRVRSSRAALRSPACRSCSRTSARRRRANRTTWASAR